ncbi:MAG TPA: hypothetical protein IAB65_05315 [Candidatus Onthocola stercorigallinarum]|nr:hypothetical protein [Candidatus Onthocola stercorigallinarum]
MTINLLNFDGWDFTSLTSVGINAFLNHTYTIIVQNQTQKELLVSKTIVISDLVQTVE